jgi:hypothetical protein
MRVWVHDMKRAIDDQSSRVSSRAVSISNGTSGSGPAPFLNASKARTTGGSLSASTALPMR